MMGRSLVHRRDQDLGVEHGAAAPDTFPFDLVAAGGARFLEVRLRGAVLALDRREEAGVIAADDFVGLEAEQPLRAGVPADDLAVGAAHADRIVVYTVE